MKMTLLVNVNNHLIVKLVIRFKDAAPNVLFKCV